jgi:chromosome segregation ATPase
MSIFEADEPTSEEPQAAEQPQQQEQAKAEPEAGKADATVPLSALNESRAQQRQLQNEVNAMREQLQVVDTLKAELDAHRKGQVDVAAEQEFNNDPLGSLQKSVKGLEEKITNTSVEQQQREQQMAQEQEMVQNIASQVNQFKQQQPDYDLALNHIMSQQAQELQMMGATEQQISEALAQSAQQIALNALNSGQNPGEMVYNLAKLRGYQAQEPEAKPDNKLEV